MGDQLRVAIAGTGFIGRVHAHAVRVAGARLVAVAASTPESAERAAKALGAERAERLRRGHGRGRRHRRPAHLHAEPPPRAAGRRRPRRPASTSCARSRWRWTPRARPAWTPPPPRPGASLAVPYVYRFHPTVRHARAMIAAGDIGPIRLLHGSYQQDWLVSPDDDSWRVDPNVGGRSRAFADIGSHWCDLVEFASGHRIARVLARTATVVPERAVGSGPAFSSGGRRRAGSVARWRPRTWPWSCSRPTRGRSGRSSSARCRPGARTGCGSSSTAPTARWCSTRSSRSGWRSAAGRGGPILFRDPATMAPDAARLATMPAGHAQGYQDCFNLFVADAYAAVGGDGAGGASDGGRRRAVRPDHRRRARLGASETWQEVGS